MYIFIVIYFNDTFPEVLEYRITAHEPGLFIHLLPTFLPCHPAPAWQGPCQPEELTLVADIL